MKEFTVKLSESVFKDLKHELRLLQMMKPDGLSFTETALIKMFEGWSKNETPLIVYKMKRRTYMSDLLMTFWFMGAKMGDVELSIGKTGHIPLIGDRVYINRLDGALYNDDFSDGDECIITGIEYVLDTWNDVKIRSVGSIEFLHVKTGIYDEYNDFHLRTEKEV